MRVVSKFGGSSVRNAEALKKVSSIIDQTKPALVVLSATYNTTNELEQLVQCEEDQRDTLILKLLKKHVEIVEQLGIENQCLVMIEKLISECSGLVKEFSPERMDQIYSIGERLSSGILYEHLKSQGKDCLFLDARELITTNDKFSAALPDIEATIINCQKYKSDFGNKLIVTQGFIGSTIEGVTTTLGREGSDYSAAILAEAFDADAVNIWTDVEGIATVDPRLCQSAHYIDHMSYEQAELLATNGAKVLFPRTMAPLKRKEIPLYVKSTFAPEIKGTCISTTSITGDLAIAMAYEDGVLSILTNNPEKVESMLNLECLVTTPSIVKFRVSIEKVAEIHQAIFPT